MIWDSGVSPARTLQFSRLSYICPYFSKSSQQFSCVSAIVQLQSSSGCSTDTRRIRGIPVSNRFSRIYPRPLTYCLCLDGNLRERVAKGEESDFDANGQRSSVQCTCKHGSPFPQRARKRKMHTECLVETAVRGYLLIFPRAYGVSVSLITTRFILAAITCLKMSREKKAHFPY